MEFIIIYFMEWSSTKRGFVSFGTGDGLLLHEVLGIFWVRGTK